MYLVNFKLVASGVDSLVAQDYVDISTCSLIRSAADNVIMYVHGQQTDGFGDDTITITVEGTDAEKQAHVNTIARELARMVNRSKHVGIQHSNKLDTVGQNFLNLTSASMTGNNAILTITVATSA